MALKSNVRLIGYFGLSLSCVSLVIHILLARYSAWRIMDASLELHQKMFMQEVMIGWPTSENVFRVVNSRHKLQNVWRPVKALKHLRPFASQRMPYPGSTETNNGFLFVRIKGDFNDIRSSICDVAVVARLLNVTLLLPELQEASVSSEFKEFGYLYDEDHFMSVLAKEIKVIKKLPKHLKMVKQKKMKLKYPPSKAPVKFYLKEVLPELQSRGVLGLVISGGGCLQALLPDNMAEYQRLRCRVSFEALQFRREIKELGYRMVHRLQALGQPYLAFHSGLELEALAYHGCGERYQDVHTELIRYRRALMLDEGELVGELDPDSEIQRINGSCPLTPEEAGILLRALGYGPHTRIYISGNEIFGGQRILVPLRAMFRNLEDRLTLTTKEERAALFGSESPLPEPSPSNVIMEDENERLRMWEIAGPRPRPLPPPPHRHKFSHEVEGWWGWIVDTDKEPEPTPYEVRERDHRLVWSALDYIVCMEATAFFPGFDLDGKGMPNFASLIMGHRLYASPSLRTYRPNRKRVVKLLDELGDELYHPNQTWIRKVRNHFEEALGEASLRLALHERKPLSFLSHPFPECMCRVVPVDKHVKQDVDSKEHICPDFVFEDITNGGEVNGDMWGSDFLSGPLSDENVDAKDIDEEADTDDSER